MPIYICKNCGNLTETEEKINLFCSNCGASLEESKPQDETPSQPVSKPEVQTPSSQSPTDTPVTERASAQKPKEDEGLVEPQVLDQKSSEGSDASQKIDEASTDRQPEKQQAPIDLPELGQTTPPPRLIAGETSSQTHTFVDSTHEIMEIYENKNLVACPQCGYGCDPSWAECPICSAKISDPTTLQKISESDFTVDENKLKQELIPCPKCNYFCDPSWESCPICQTALKKADSAD